MPLRPTHARLLFWPALAVWGWLLVKPNPVPELLTPSNDLLKFLLAKTLHAGVYAALTALAMIGRPVHRRWPILLVVLHGVLTELGQYYGNLWFDTKRGGCVRDVLIDWAGVAAGFAVWWVTWRSGWRSAMTRLGGGEGGKETDQESWSGQVG